MKKKVLFLSLAILLILAGILMAGQRRGCDDPRHMMRMLELTDTQESQILDLKLDLEKQVLPLKTSLRELRSQMKLEMTADNFNQNKASKLIDQMSELQKEIQMKRVLHQRAVRDILTDEQKKKFDLHLMSRGEKRGGFPGHAHRGKRPMND